MALKKDTSRIWKCQELAFRAHIGIGFAKANQEVMDMAKRPATGELPMGLSMMMGQSPEAMNSFSSMSADQQRGFVARAHSVRSKQEMQALIDSLTQ